ncbi:MAG: hypothetical protein ABIA93_03860 [Candidatus Woesearchaeota archaeon]
MANMTLSIPEELHEIMRKHKEIHWGNVAREAMWNQAQKLKELEWMDKVLSKSKLTEKDAIEIGRKINAGIAKRHRESLKKSSSTQTESSLLSSQTGRAGASSSAINSGS